VNAAHVITDVLLHPAIEGEASVPPEPAVDGACWLVGPDAASASAGHAGELACFEAGAWIFTAPKDGMRVFDRSTGQHVLFAGGWRRIDAPSEPTGGATIDGEARAAIALMIAALRDAGIYPRD
jgi:hypothetical protein